MYMSCKKKSATAAGAAIPLELVCVKWNNNNAHGPLPENDLCTSPVRVKWEWSVSEALLQYRRFSRAHSCADREGQISIPRPAMCC